LEFRGDFWHQQTRVPGLSHHSHGIVCVILGLAIFVELCHVTDRQTDTMTAYTVLA